MKGDLLVGEPRRGSSSVENEKNDYHIIGLGVEDVGTNGCRGPGDAISTAF